MWGYINNDGEHDCVWDCVTELTKQRDEARRERDEARTVTDAKEPAVVTSFRSFAKPCSYVKTVGLLLNHTEGNEIVSYIDTLTRERDEAVKRRREIDDEAFDYAEQIETLKTQLASARELMEFARIELGGEERDGSEHTHWCVACDDHVDGNHVVRNMLDAALTAALTQEDA
jgi:hypothetical protein